MSRPYSVALITVPDKAAADKLVDGLVNGKLAACVNVVPGVESTYWWKGKVEKAKELILLAKTRTDLMPEVCEFVRKNHPASIPEIISWPIDRGFELYLDWVGANTRFA
ncbi:MAG: divalent-cation tolerance protein CutA, partial [Elusimicrobia bacterium]|nr:divalent-cation tolerance protein CutA [Elusimicrobiota bacterium]